jgi:hypothetical protein
MRDPSRRDHSPVACPGGRCDRAIFRSRSVGVRSCPSVALPQQVNEWNQETFRRGGVHLGVDARRFPLFRRGGLPGPSVRQDISGGGKALRPVDEQCPATVRSLLPRMEPFGIATAEAVRVESLAERLERETVAADSQVACVPAVAAWTTKG